MPGTKRPLRSKGKGKKILRVEPKNDVELPDQNIQELNLPDPSNQKNTALNPTANVDLNSKKNQLATQELWNKFNSDLFHEIFKYIHSYSDKLSFASTISDKGARNNLLKEIRSEYLIHRRLKNTRFDFPDKILYEDIDNKDKAIFLFLVFVGCNEGYERFNSVDLPHDILCNSTLTDQLFNILYPLLKIEIVDFNNLTKEVQVNELMKRNIALLIIWDVLLRKKYGLNNPRSTLVCEVIDRKLSDNEIDLGYTYTALNTSNNYNYFKAKLCIFNHFPKEDSLFKYFYNNYPLALKRLTPIELTEGKVYLSELCCFIGMKNQNPEHLDYGRLIEKIDIEYVVYYIRLHAFSKLPGFEKIIKNVKQKFKRWRDQDSIAATCLYQFLQAYDNVATKIIIKYPELLSLLTDSQSAQSKHVVAFFCSLMRDPKCPSALLEQFIMCNQIGDLNSFISAYKNHAFGFYALSLIDISQLRELQESRLPEHMLKQQLLLSFFNKLPSFDAIYHFYIKMYPLLINIDALCAATQVFSQIAFIKPIQPSQLNFTSRPNTEHRPLFISLLNDLDASEFQVFYKSCLVESMLNQIVRFCVFFTYQFDKIVPQYIHSIHHILFDLIKHKDNEKIKKFLDTNHGLFVVEMLKLFTKMRFYGSHHKLLTCLSANLTVFNPYNRFQGIDHQCFLKRMSTIVKVSENFNNKIWTDFFSGTVDQLIDWIMNEDFYELYEKESFILPFLLAAYGNNWGAYFKDYMPLKSLIVPLASRFYSSIRSVQDLRRLIEVNIMSLSHMNHFEYYLQSNTIDEICQLATTYLDNDSLRRSSLLQRILTNPEIYLTIPVDEILLKKESLFKTATQSDNAGDSSQVCVVIFDNMLNYVLKVSPVQLEKRLVFLENLQHVLPEDRAKYPSGLETSFKYRKLVKIVMNIAILTAQNETSKQCALQIIASIRQYLITVDQINQLGPQEQTVHPEICLSNLSLTKLNDRGWAALNEIFRIFQFDKIKFEKIIMPEDKENFGWINENLYNTISITTAKELGLESNCLWKLGALRWKLLWSAINKSSSLKLLSLSNNSLGEMSEDSVAEFCDGIEISTLTNLNIANNHLNKLRDKSFEQFFGALFGSIVESANFDEEDSFSDSQWQFIIFKLVNNFSLASLTFGKMTVPPQIKEEIDLYLNRNKNIINLIKNAIRTLNDSQASFNSVILMKEFDELLKLLRYLACNNNRSTFILIEIILKTLAQAYCKMPEESNRVMNLWLNIPQENPEFIHARFHAFIISCFNNREDLFLSTAFFHALPLCFETGELKATDNEQQSQIRQFFFLQQKIIDCYLFKIIGGVSPSWEFVCTAEMRLALLHFLILKDIFTSQMESETKQHSLFNGMVGAVDCLDETMKKLLDPIKVEDCKTLVGQTVLTVVWESFVAKYYQWDKFYAKASKENAPQIEQLKQLINLISDITKQKSKSTVQSNTATPTTLPSYLLESQRGRKRDYINTNPSSQSEVSIKQSDIVEASVMPTEPSASNIMELS